MTIVEIDAGSCGLQTCIEVSRSDALTVSVSLSSECRAVEEWGGRLKTLNWGACLGEKSFSSEIFTAAANCLKHPACPVCIGLLKAIEVEVGASLPAQTTIRFPAT